MKRTDDQRTTKIDSAHAENAANMPHDRNELRRQLLKMILKNEAERRAAPLERNGRRSSSLTARLRCLPI